MTAGSKMGTKERREREKQELRQAILDAALRIAGSEGWQAVTMRKVADQIEYSAPTIYEYFESKDAILQALVREGHERMLAGLRTAVANTPDPAERMVRCAINYARMAWDNPELYQVMHNLSGAACHMEAPPPEME